MTTQLQRGVDSGQLIGGLMTAGVGVAGIVATASGMRFAYRSLALPEWLMYLLGALLVVIGAFKIKSAMKVLKCACGTTLDDGRVILPGDGGREAMVVQTVRSGQVAPLAALVGQSNDFSLKLDLKFCSSCEQTASLTLLKDDSQKLVQDQVVVGAPAAVAIAFMKQYGKVDDD